MKVEYEVQISKMISFYLRTHSEINKENWKEEKDLVLEIQKSLNLNY